MLSVGKVVIVNNYDGHQARERGGGAKALMSWPLVEEFFAASLRHHC